MCGSFENRTLRRPRRYVRADLLLPGDVFLSRSTDKDSNWIAWATLGPFSHAAIYPAKYNYCLFESSDDGVGFVSLDVVKICRDSGRTGVSCCSTSRIIKSWRSVAHPNSLSVAARTVVGRRSRIACRVSGAEVWLRVPGARGSLERGAVSSRVVVKPVLWAIARVRREPAAVVPGLFCSQVVFEALKYLRAAPLKRDRLSETVSPNTLASPCLSRLEVVDGVIVDETFDCEPLDPGSTALKDIHLLQDSLLRQANTAREQGYKKPCSERMRVWRDC